MERPNLFEALTTANGEDLAAESLPQNEASTSATCVEEEFDIPLSGNDETSDEEGPLPPDDGESPDISEDDLEEEEEDETPAAVTQTAKDGTAWQSVPTAPKQAKTPAKNIYKAPPTQLKGCQNVNTALDALCLFVNDKIVSDICTFTNIEGQRVKGEGWVGMDIVECLCLIGLLLFLGCRKQNMLSTERIWDTIHGTGLVRACMSRKRFQTLMTFLRFDDKSTRNARRQKDAFAPFRNVWDDFMNTLTNHYIPGPLLTIDEQLVPFRGRCSFLQYLPSKPDRYGIKVFWVADADNNFPLLGKPYLGRPAGQDRQLNLGRNTATDLATPFFKSGRNITCDNYFTDLVLAQSLLKNGLTLVGTVRGNKRFLPDSFKAGKNLALHESEFAYNDVGTVVNYQSKRKKNVVVLSTMHDTGVVDSDSNPKKKPEMVLFYNSTKGAVDTIDKMAHACTVKRKTQRWPMVMFSNIIDLATIAARCIWSIRFPDDSLSKKDARSLFIESIGEQLMMAQIKRRMAEVVMPRSLFQLAEKTITHLESKVAPTRSQGRSTSVKKQTATKRAASEAAPKVSKKRCLFYHWRLDRKTKHRCEEFICPDHEHKVCPQCIKIIAPSK